MLESIGGIVLIGLALYLYLKSISNKEDANREKERLIRHNDKSQDLINDYNKSILRGNPIMTHKELTKKLHQIVGDPIEKQKSLDEIESLRKFKEASIQKHRNERKFGYKYDNEIFEIFDTNRSLTKQVILKKIKSRFNIDIKQANELFDSWKKNGLISKCYKNPDKIEVGLILTERCFSLDETDLTRDKWLEQNNKKLKPKK